MTIVETDVAKNILSSGGQGSHSLKPKMNQTITMKLGLNVVTNHAVLRFAHAHNACDLQTLHADHASVLTTTSYVPWPCIAVFISTGYCIYPLKILITWVITPELGTPHTVNLELFFTDPVIIN